MDEKEKVQQQSEGCSSDCSHCASAGNCGSQPHSLLEETNSFNNIKKVIAIVSGKGGVGKSLVTSLMAVNMQRKGYRTSILDADITGPSIPKAFGLTAKAFGNKLGILPVRTKTGIGTMSVNNLLENDTEPVLWRGPVIAGTVKQFWTETLWKDVDYMFVDMPPGTGDVPLTVFQSLPVDGIIIVTSPQELVGMIVAKAVNMAKKMNVPILGIVENMSYLECPDCGKHINVFGESHTEQVAEEYGLKLLAQIPIDPKIAQMVDGGQVEYIEMPWFEEAVKAVENL